MHRQMSKKAAAKTGNERSQRENYPGGLQLGICAKNVRDGLLQLCFGVLLVSPLWLT